MTTIQLILLKVIVFCAGIEVGILISNFNRNRFLSKHGISPKNLITSLNTTNFLKFSRTKLI